MLKALQVRKNIILLGFILTLTLTALWQINCFLDNQKERMEKQMSDEMFLNIIKNRLNRVNTLCKKHLLDGTTKLVAEHLYWFVQDQIVYCPVFKSASSTWLHNMVDISNVNESVKLRARKVHKRSLIEQVKYIGAIQPSPSDWSQ